MIPDVFRPLFSTPLKLLTCIIGLLYHWTHGVRDSFRRIYMAVSLKDIDLRVGVGAKFLLTAQSIQISLFISSGDGYTSRAGFRRTLRAGSLIEMCTLR
ncbi:hypothetical protein B0H34DRAFT_423390 [Crassisporium funariophilum]|nr:hypothetical protein B0H34DRAFT_423390 [Crassisporium funariophilum]